MVVGGLQDRDAEAILDEVGDLAMDTTVLISSIPETRCEAEDPECTMVDNMDAKVSHILVRYHECKIVIEGIHASTGIE